MNVHPLFVKRLASRYFELYAKDTKQAKILYDEMIKGNDQLEKDVKKELALLIRKKLGGK